MIEIDWCLNETIDLAPLKFSLLFKSRDTLYIYVLVRFGSPINLAENMLIIYFYAYISYISNQAESQSYISVKIESKPVGSRDYSTVIQNRPKDRYLNFIYVIYQNTVS